MPNDVEPVAGRECGPCAVCCTALKIVDPALDKEAGVRCVHVVEQGCAIHATRPATCRSFFCGWRLIPQLGDEWRPDRSGVLVSFIDCDVAGYATTAFRLTTWNRNAILQPFVLDFIAGNIERRLPTYFVFAQGIGPGLKTFLNDRMTASGGPEGAAQGLDRIMDDQIALLGL